MGVRCQLQLRIIDSSKELYDLKTSWDKILGGLNECPPFLTWEWMYTWWEVYKTDTTKLLVLVISDNSNIVAIAPFYIRKKIFPIPCKTVYILGTGEPESKEVFSEYIDLIVIPSYAKTVSVLLKSYFVSNYKVWDRIELPRVLESSILQKYFFRDMSDEKYLANKLMCGLRYFIMLPDSWDKYIRSLRPSMRRSIAVAYKKILQKSDYKIEVIESDPQIKEVMGELIELHTKSWRGKGKPGAFASQEFCEFHHKVARLMYKNNNLLILKISLPNDVVAVLYNFKLMGTSYYYQSGLNMQRYSSLKPGVLMHSEAIKDAIHKGMTTYDFMMAGENSYKSNYGCKTSEMFHIDVWNKGLKSLFIQKLALLPYFRRVK